jgi:hypothetical protein
MPKKTIKPKKTKKSCVYDDPRSVFCRPSTWLVAVLALALFVIYGISMYGFKTLGKRTSLETAELRTFGHIAKTYIKDMEFEVSDQPTIKEATGYGVSDEDGVLYITFDFAVYPTSGTSYSSLEDLNPRHGIIYFQYDAERGTYGHAFSYHDDASYHPDGTYVKF